MHDDRVRNGFVRLTKLHELDPKTQTDQQWIDAAAVREIAPRSAKWDDDGPQAGWVTSWTDIGFGGILGFVSLKSAETVIDMVAKARQTIGPNWWEEPAPILRRMTPP